CSLRRARGKDLALIRHDDKPPGLGVDLLQDTFDTARAIGDGARPRTRCGWRRDRHRRASLADTCLRRFDRPPEQGYALSANDVPSARGATHLNPVAGANVVETAGPHEDLRRAVDRSAEAVVLGRHRIGVDGDLIAQRIVGSDDDAVSTGDRVRNRPGDAPASAFLHVRTRPPDSTILSKGGDSSERREDEDRSYLFH